MKRKADAQSLKLLNHFCRGYTTTTIGAATYLKIASLHTLLTRLEDGSFDKLYWPLKRERVTYSGVSFKIYSLDMTKLTTKQLQKKSILTEK